LLWTVARAIERYNLIRENRRMVQADRHRLQQEQLEADRLLGEQRGLIRDLEALSRAQAKASEGQENGDSAEQSSSGTGSLALPEGSRRRYSEQLHPPRQLVLPGFPAPE